MVVSAQRTAPCGGARRRGRPFRMQNRSRLSSARLRGQRAIILRVKNYIIHARGERTFGARLFSRNITYPRARRKPHVRAFPRGIACNTVMSVEHRGRGSCAVATFLRSENGPRRSVNSLRRRRRYTLHHAFVTIVGKKISETHVCHTRHTREYRYLNVTYHVPRSVSIKCRFDLTVYKTVRMF